MARGGVLAAVAMGTALVLSGCERHEKSAPVKPKPAAVEAEPTPAPGAQATPGTVAPYSTAPTDADYAGESKASPTPSVVITESTPTQQ